MSTRKVKVQSTDYNVQEDVEAWAILIPQKGSLEILKKEDEKGINLVALK